MEKKDKILVTADNIEVGKKVCDKDGNIGIIKECDDLHNVYVEYDGGGSGLHCLIEGCKEKGNVNGAEIEIEHYDALYYFE